MLPASRVGDITASGDAITGPGMPTVFIAGVPASVMGDSVSGTACTGAVTVGNPTILIGGRPATISTSPVTGVNPVSGVPVATVVSLGAPTVLF